jgi:hypothetical protein
VVGSTLSLPVHRLLLRFSLAWLLSLSTLCHHSNFYRCSDSLWVTEGAMLRKRSSCHPSPLKLAPAIVPLLYFSRAPSGLWWVATAVANGNISQMIDGRKTVLPSTPESRASRDSVKSRYMSILYLAMGV